MMVATENHALPADTTDRATAVLVENHRQFLRYLERRVGNRALAAFADELQTASTPLPDLQNEICTCVSRLAETLKREYRDALQQIDVDGTTVKDFAERHGVSANNAGVRVFRARQALKQRVMESCATCAEHGCIDCTCQSPAVSR